MLDSGTSIDMNMLEAVDGNKSIASVPVQSTKEKKVVPRGLRSPDLFGVNETIYH
jgi:hypothetical protein